MNIKHNTHKSYSTGAKKKIKKEKRIGAVTAVYKSKLVSIVKVFYGAEN